MAKNKTSPWFADMSEAFSYCRRDVGHPVIVHVLGVRFKLYPSGRADALPALKEKIVPKLNKEDLERSARVRDRLNSFFREAGLP